MLSGVISFPRKPYYAFGSKPFLFVILLNVYSKMCSNASLAFLGLGAGIRLVLFHIAEKCPFLGGSLTDFSNELLPLAARITACSLLQMTAEAVGAFESVRSVVLITR